MNTRNIGDTISKRILNEFSDVMLSKIVHKQIYFTSKRDIEKFVKKELITIGINSRGNRIARKDLVSRIAENIEEKLVHLLDVAELLDIVKCR